MIDIFIKNIVELHVQGLYMVFLLKWHVYPHAGTPISSI